MMSENALKPLNGVDLKPNSKIMIKKGPLSVINGDINSRKRCNNTQKLGGKTQKQDNSENNPHILNVPNIPSFKGENGNISKLKWSCHVNKQDQPEKKGDILCTQTVSHLKQDEKAINSATDENCLLTSTNDFDGEVPADKEQIKDVLSSECNEISTEIKKENVLLQEKNNNGRLTVDVLWSTPYKQDIYEYLKSVEKNFRPNPKYMEKQSDLNMNMRSVLVDWFIEVGEEYKLQAETLYLAVSYVDRFLSHMSVLRGKLQLVGTASMFLAAKFEEIYPPELTDFVYITDDTYTKKQILRMEHLILKVLNFDVSVPTPLTFLQLFCSMSCASEVVMYLSQYICELSLLDGDPFLKFTPSTIAAGSLALANYVLGFDMWDEDIAASSGYKLSDIMYVILCLFNKYSAMPTCQHQAIREKYKSPKFSAVATIPQPENLIFPENSSKRLCYI